MCVECGEDRMLEDPGRLVDVELVLRTILDLVDLKFGEDADEALDGGIWSPVGLDPRTRLDLRVGAQDYCDIVFD